MFTYQEVAKRWNVQVHDVQRLVYTGKLKRLKLSHKKVRFRPSDIEAYEKAVLR